MSSLDLFESNTATERDGDSTIISCKRGLWSVAGPCYGLVKQEAIRYFMQYHADGEYDKPDTSVADLIKECNEACEIDEVLNNARTDKTALSIIRAWQQE